MRRLVLSVLLAFCALGAFAQPRSVGVKVGYNMEYVYQHDITSGMFVDASLGTTVEGGFRIASAVNGIFYSFDIPEANFNLYWSAGVATGYVKDEFKVSTELPGATFVETYRSGGFMFGFTPGIGMECNLDIPLQLSVELRPVFGFHIGTYYNGSQTGFYDRGMFGFIPSVSARYRF